MRHELKTMADGLIETVKGYVRTVQDGLSLRIDGLEQTIKAIPSGPNGKDGEPGVKGEDGKSITVDDVAPLIKDEVTKAVDCIPRPEVDYVRVTGVVKEIVSLIPVPSNGIDGKDGDRGQDGKDADPEAITKEVLARVTEVLESIPTPKDGLNGKDADPEMVRAAVVEELSKQEDSAELFAKALITRFAQVEYAG